jgi:hypothetical protein
MQLRNSYILKFFAILLFSFELLAPSLVTSECTLGKESNTASIQTAVPSSFYSLLFLEECNEEEREGKDALFLAIELYSFKYLSFVSNTCHTSIPFHVKQNLFDTHPPLYQLNQVFII